MNTFSRHRLALLIVLALVVLAGCGSSNGSEAPSKAAFIKQADAICEKADQEQTNGLKKVAEKGSLEKMNSSEQLELAVEVGLPPIEQEGEKLGELTPPAGDESEVEAFIESIEQATKKAEADPSLLNGGAGPYKKADQLGKSYGFKACAESS